MLRKLTSLFCAGCLVLATIGCDQGAEQTDTTEPAAANTSDESGSTDDAAPNANSANAEPEADGDGVAEEVPADEVDAAAEGDSAE